MIEEGKGGRPVDDDWDLHQATVAPSEAEYVASLMHDAIEGQKLSVVCFFLDGGEYAFEVSDALEVLRPRSLTTVPRTPDFVMGIMSVRGEMVPVLDLRKRLRIGSCGELADSRVVVASVDEIKAGFVVDRLAGVEEVSKKLVRPPGKLTPALPDGFLKGVIKVKKRVVRLLDIENLLDFTLGG